MAVTSPAAAPTGRPWQPGALIRTKLYIPQVRANRVPRPALLARLDAGRAGKLTLISAPAGFGKTTLLAEWLAHAQTPVAWVSLDARDNDPVRFGAYLVAALQTLELGLGRAPLSLLNAEAGPPPSLETLFTLLINEVTEVAGDFGLVLDDYHHIESEVVHAAVMFLLDHLPPQMHLVIASRADPPLPLAQLRARGQLMELRAEDLRFTLDEARAFLTGTMGLRLPDEAVAALDARTEGWVASLQLAALALGAHGAAGAPADPAQFMQTFSGSHRYIVDYLAEQVLLQQPEPVQTFLLETSILERLSGPLCDYVLDQGEGSQAALDHLEAGNLFLSRLDDQRQWFRYHPLFADFLQARLRQARPQRWAPLHRRAAEWCLQANLLEDAVRHALAAEDYALATELIEQVAETLWARSHISLMLGWMQALPPELLRSQPRLSLQAAWAHAVDGHLDAVEPLRQAAEAALAERAGPPAAQPARRPPTEDEWHASDERLRTSLLTLRAFVARFRGEPHTAVALAEQALAQIPPNCLRARVVAQVVLGHARLLLGQVEAADQALTEARSTALSIRHWAARLSATNYLAFLRVMQGRLRAAAALFREDMACVAETEGAALSGIERIGLGAVLREQNELDEAEQLIDSGLRLAEAGGDFTFMRDGYIARARLDQARGAWDSALRYMEKAEAVARRSSTNRDLGLIQAWRARLGLAQGSLAEASHWAQLCRLSASDEPTFATEYGLLTLARVLLADGRLDEAGRLLDRLQRTAQAEGRQGRALEALALQGLVLHARGETSAALAALKRALALAEPEGYVRVFVDEGAPMARLLLALQQHSPGGLPAYPARLLAALGVPARPAAALGRDSGAVLVEPLSERERDVLRLVARGLSNQAIAGELVVAQSTIQWHIKNIYSKLNVHSRTQAALAARELGLVG